MMVVQETQDLLDPLVLQGHRHCLEPTDHNLVFPDLQVPPAHRELLAVDLGWLS